MPYKNVHYIKIMLELLDDRRFIKECNDSQKLDYLLWLCMAGLTQNDSEEDLEWFKTRFNLQKEVGEIRSNLCFLLGTFKKMYRQPRNKKAYIKFKKFKELHNPIRIAEGMPKDSQRDAQNIIKYIRIEYIKIKQWKIEDFSPDDYARTGKAIKTLLIKAKGNKDLIIKSLQWANSQKWCDWTLETVIRRWLDFMKFKDTPKAIPEYHKPKEEPYITEPPKEFKELVKQIADKKGVDKK